LGGVEGEIEGVIERGIEGEIEGGIEGGNNLQSLNSVNLEIIQLKFKL
jgi:hypothetical protein